MDPEKTKERTRDAYNKVGSDYDSWYWAKRARELRAELTERAISILKSGLETQDSKQPRILDLCCGTGHLVPHLSKLGDYTGVDFAPSMITHCKENFPDNKFVLGDAESLPFEDNSFDAVVCFWSFHHLLYPLRAIKQMHRVLKPGGLVLIVTFKDAKLNLMAKLGDIISGAYWGYTTMRYSKKGMHGLLNKRFNSLDVEISPKGFSILNAMGIRFLIATGRK